MAPLCSPPLLHSATLPSLLRPHLYDSFFLPLASLCTCQHSLLTQTHTYTHTVDHIEEDREFREDKLLFWPSTTRLLSDVAMRVGGGRRERGSQDGDARQGQILTTGFIVEVQGFHYQSV